MSSASDRFVQRYASITSQCLALTRVRTVLACLSVCAFVCSSVCLFYFTISGLWCIEYMACGRRCSIVFLCSVVCSGAPLSCLTKPGARDGKEVFFFICLHASQFHVSAKGSLFFSCFCMMPVVLCSTNSPSGSSVS